MNFDRAVRRAALVCVVAVAASCSSDSKSTPANQGPNTTKSDPGPNTTLSDPGPNPTNGAAETLSGEFTVVGGTCARLVLDAKAATLELVLPKGYSVNKDGLILDNKVVAPIKARVFITGRRTQRNGTCGRVTNVENVVSVRAQ